MGEDLDNVVLFCKMPTIMGDGAKAFKDSTMVQPNDSIKDNLRVNIYIELLRDLGNNAEKPDEALWWKVVIDLPEPAFSTTSYY